MQCNINFTLTDETDTTAARNSNDQNLSALNVSALSININQRHASSVQITEIQNNLEEADGRVFKQAYGMKFTPILKVYKSMGKRSKKIKGILKKDGNATTAKKLAAKKLKTVSFDFKNKHAAPLILGEDTPLTDKNLRRSTRMKKKLQGYKNETSRVSSEAMVMHEGPGNQGEITAKGSLFFHFPGPVKFPTLTELEICENPYPFIPTYVLQAVALHQCSVPPEEVTRKLLEAPTQDEDGGKDGRPEARNLVINE